MNSAIVSGSCGLLGFATCERLLKDGWKVVGIDNDRRQHFFGADASTSSMAETLIKNPHYCHIKADIRSQVAKYAIKDGADMIVHTAAQPSHDWSTNNVVEDFTVNALGTVMLLEAWRKYCPKAQFIHVSTSKVFGDNPNRLPLVETETRYDLPGEHPLWHGIPETFSTDGAIHSPFGCSKLAGDVYAQEYGKNFGLPVTVFRPGCITGAAHRGAELHGFLSYLAKCIKTGTKYRVYGYGGKQVRCNVHADDLVDAMLLAANKPIPGEVYCIGGRGLDCSMVEAIAELSNRIGKTAVTEYVDKPRTGDHVWWVSDSRKFCTEFNWRPRRDLSSIFDELCASD